MGLFGSDPAEAAMPYLNQAQEQYQPYADQGQAAYGQLNPIYGQMTQDPAAYLEKMMQGYQPSHSYQMKEQQLRNAAGNTAAAGGMRGTLNDIQNQAGLTDMLMSDDMQQWLQNVMGINNMGIQGQQGFYNNGYDANNNIANILGTKGTLAYQGQANQNQGMSDLISGLVKAGGMAGGMMLGGPAGAMGGGMLGDYFGKMMGPGGGGAMAGGMSNPGNRYTLFPGGGS